MRAPLTGVDGLAIIQRLHALMPEMNGFRATEQLKQACPHVKVLALTVHEDKGYLRQILAAGATGRCSRSSADRGS
jgi:DNA-binding NarL/FixJ family response regulator